MTAPYVLCGMLALLAIADGFMVAPIKLLTSSSSSSSSRSRCRLRMDSGQDDEGYISWLTHKVERARRPPFVKIARARLQRDFAVLLMRSSYQQVVDDLDFVPMDDFQKQFFLLRQGEWLDYKSNFPRIKQGDLTDPDYFDFISFAQYASIAEAMRNGRDFFEERVGAEGDKRTVQRDANFKDNARLPQEHARRVGDRLLAYCADTFSSTNLAPVVAQGQSVTELREGCDKILNILRLNFYLLDYAVTADLDRRVLIVKATAPATIWGQQVLMQRRDTPVNDFEAKAVLSYLRVCGFGAATYTTAFRNLDAIHTFRLL
ncbi:unnamed protein product [Pylaiella littoralis]